MRYYLFKSSRSKIILIKNSQRRHFESEYLRNHQNVYNFDPPINQYRKIILYICVNDLYNDCKPSDKTPIDTASQLIELANFSTERTTELFLMGIPERSENKERSAALNEIHEKVSAKRAATNPNSTGNSEESVSIYQAQNTSTPMIIFTSTNLVVRTSTTLSSKNFCTRITK